MRINELRDNLFNLGNKHCLDLRIAEIIVDDITTYIDVDIYYPGGRFTIATFLKEKQYSLNIFDDVMDDLIEELQKELFEIFVEFARTPEDEREEEKRYQYRLKEKYWWIADKVYEEKTYLNFRTIRDTLIDMSLDNKKEADSYKTKFTDEEIEELAEKYDIDLNMFDKVEVLDE